MRISPDQPTLEEVLTRRAAPSIRLQPISPPRSIRDIRSSDEGSSSEFSKLNLNNSSSHLDDSRISSNTEDFVTIKDLLKVVKVRSQWQVKLNNFIDSLSVQIVLSIINIFTLFADDIRMLAFTKEEDTAFYIALILTMVIFTAEIICSSISSENYFLSLYFWIDIVSTIAILGDIGWVLPETSSVGKTATSIVKQARITKVVRIVRLIRLIKLVRISKLYKQFKKEKEMIKEKIDNKKRMSKQLTIEEIANMTKKRKSFSLPNGSTLQRRSIMMHEILEEDLEQRQESMSELSKSIIKESKVSKLLIELTTQRVVLLVVTMVFCLPLLTKRSYIDPPYVAPYAAFVLDNSYDIMGTTEFNTLCEKICNDNKDEKRYPLIYVEGPGCGPYIFNTNKDDLRESEMIKSEEGGYLVVFDIRPYTRVCAALNLTQTVFLCVLLMVSSLLFSRDVRSEERRVGTECTSWWRARGSACHVQK